MAKSSHEDERRAEEEHRTQEGGPPQEEQYPDLSHEDIVKHVHEFRRWREHMERVAPQYRLPHGTTAEDMATDLNRERSAVETRRE